MTPLLAAFANFNRLNHANQTRDFARAKKVQYGARSKSNMGIWEALDYLNTLVDDSDPDTDLSQIEHNLQTAEAIRKDGHPRWMVLTGLIHDLGKFCACTASPSGLWLAIRSPSAAHTRTGLFFPEFLKDNPDSRVPEYQTKLGVYSEGCGTRQRGPLMGS